MAFSSAQGNGIAMNKSLVAHCLKELNVPAFENGDSILGDAPSQRLRIIRRSADHLHHAIASLQAVDMRWRS
jgi:hypothetical protein